MARVGKIARLPEAVRNEINRRILDGEKGRSIIADLNSRVDVRLILEQYFDSELINDQNFSDWRKGGYQDWVDRRERLNLTKERAAYAVELARSGTGISEGAAAIIGGELLEALESLDAKDSAEKMAGMSALASVVAKIRAGDQSAEKLRQDRERLAQAEKELNLTREKFEFYKQRAQLADKTEMIVCDSTLSPAERAAKINAIYGRS